MESRKKNSNKNNKYGRKKHQININRYLSNDFSRFEGKGLTGLTNLGNTCFMNSLLQCLSHTYELNNFLDNGDYSSKINHNFETHILCEWDSLRKGMWSENCTYRPAGFREAIRKVAEIKDRCIFTGFAQNDLSEFLIFMMECFHSSIMREVTMKIIGKANNNTDKLAVKSFEMIRNIYNKEYSEFLDIFYGISVSTIKSLESNYTNVTPEPFFLLNLAIPESTNGEINIIRQGPKDMVNIYDCFDHYTKTESLGDDNKILNEETGKRESIERNISFWKLPHILVFTLKRFSNDGKKDSRYIDFPINELNLSKYISGYDSNKYVYDLYGIANHIGNSGNSGHYTSFVKVANGEWWHFNDRKKDKIKEQDIKTHYAYCFFYRKRFL